ncbi:DNA polymerase Y family protein [Streptomyces sp. CA-253872]|uniref:DNA polymerase Y family protein n=1 Tax=Streptomyces sp. CA-253872 TaxID=3240067 RepID=UPI003D8CBE23
MREAAERYGDDAGPYGGDGHGGATLGTGGATLGTGGATLGTGEAASGAGESATGVLCVRFRLSREADAPDLLPALLATVEGLTPLVQALPPDTALADVRGARRYFGRDVAELAALVRVRTLALHGVVCAIGVGPTPLIARMAAREARFGTTVTVTDDGLAAYLDRKPVIALPGVGPATARTLCSYGLDSAGRVAAAPLGTLQRILGARAGRELRARAHGIDPTPVTPDALSRALSAHRAFDRDELDRDRQRRALLSLTEELGTRLRTEDQVCASLQLTVRYADRSTTVRSRALPEPTAHTRALTATAYGLHEALGLQRARVRGLVLRAEGLRPATGAAHQLSLDPEDDKAHRLEAAADRARRRFGAGAVVPGTLAA